MVVGLGLVATVHFAEYSLRFQSYLWSCYLTRVSEERGLVRLSFDLEDGTELVLL